MSDDFTVYKITTSTRTKPMWYISHFYRGYSRTFGPFRTKRIAQSCVDKLISLYKTIDAATFKIKWKDFVEYSPFG